MIVKATYFSIHTYSNYDAQLGQVNPPHPLPRSLQPTALKGRTGDRYSKDEREYYIKNRKNLYI